MLLRMKNILLLIVDSVQTLDTPEIDGVPGSVSQIRESVASITSHAKSRNLPVFLLVT